MRISARILVAVAVLALLGGLAALGWWHQAHQQAGPTRTAGTLTVDVTSAADRGPGTLREALFIVAAANGKAEVWLKVRSIVPESPLPPLVNPHGVRIRAEQDAEIDAHALKGGPVLDVAGANTSIEGLHLRNCPAAAILLRAAQFRLHSSSIDACDVGVDVAENASDILLEANRFSGNRIGVRFAASNRNGLVAGNTFSSSRDAGVWAVRAEPDARNSAITIRENHFDGGRSGVVAANVALTLERNEFSANAESAVHLLG
ncbi:MAG: right-handed parallel beta-helix repeat-containing protein, partial [Gammaproteobacteria bacterium]|nr:right-handed parallel beta-helix repeat-containing protein [Gammaproteobacteria bacterium]